MAVFGIIAEYNPFHNGHIYQFNKIREFDNDASIIVAMSGNITQRGEFALFDKWQRAELAVRNGADLVLELPVVFAVRSAQYFAQGGIRLFNSLKIIDFLCFGMEADNLSDLEEIVNLTLAEGFDIKIKEQLAKGLPYAAAVSESLRESSEYYQELIRLPNNILAIEYLKSLKKVGSLIKPFALKRLQSHHNDTELGNSFASSTAIRKAVVSGRVTDVKPVVPKDVYSSLLSAAQENNLPNIENLFRTFLSIAYSFTAEKYRHLYGINEGFEHLIWDACQNSSSFKELTNKITTRRYPLTRIKRLIMTILLQLSKEHVTYFSSCGPRYYRVLAFSRRGQQLLHEIKKLSSLPIITNVPTELNSRQIFTEPLDERQQMLAFDVKAVDLYNLARPKIKTTGEDFTHSPAVIK